VRFTSAAACTGALHRFGENRPAEGAAITWWLVPLERSRLPVNQDAANVAKRVGVFGGEMTKLDTHFDVPGLERSSQSTMPLCYQYVTRCCC